MLDSRGIDEHIPLLRATVTESTRDRVPVECARETRHTNAPDVGGMGGERSTPSTSRASRVMSITESSTLESYFDLNVYVIHAKRLVSDLRPYEALLLVPLSFGEMALTKLTGTVAGSVYKSLVDLDSKLFYTTVYKAALYYALFALLAAAQEYVKSSLALAWRRRLTTIVHEAYFRDPLKMRTVHGKLDNCDQRMTSEVEGLCSTLAEIVQKVSASPFKVVFYGYLAGTYIGFTSLCLVVAFFALSVWLQKLVALPLARDLVRLERREGDFRSGHMRVRRASADIGLQSERTAEERMLNGALGGVLGMQGVVVWRRTAMSGVTRVIDYGGALMNYVVIAVAVFLGGAGGSEEPPVDSGGGDRAAFVSNASFFTLTLIYTLTEIVDLGPAVSKLTSLLCRVYGMLEVLQDDREEWRGGEDTADRAEHGEALGLDSPPSRSSGSPRGEFEVVLVPSIFELGVEESKRSTKPAIMEIAVVTLRGSLLNEVMGVFPSLRLQAPPHSTVGKSITCVMTMQPRKPLDLDSMDASLNVFLEWEQAMVTQLGDAWCNAVDPKTGKALRDISSSSCASASWSEVRAFHAFLKYPVDERGACPLILHPVHGSDTYPASFFTTASPQVCIEALRKIGTLHDRGVGSGLAVLSVRNETIWCGEPGAPERVPLLTGINIDLEPGRHLLITGPNGSGKTTLLRYLCQRLQQKELQDRCPPLSRAIPSPRRRRTTYMYVPQAPLIGPGNFLWQQLAYPGDTKPTEVEMLEALQIVGLGELTPWLPETPSNSRDWGACLSFGEQQRLCIARVCLHKPVFALMDEATSGMDAASSARILRKTQQLTTVVLVTHDVDELEGMFDIRVDL